jgi:hypothetical protein
MLSMRGGIRPITPQDNISWNDLKNASPIPLGLFFSALLGKKDNENLRGSNCKLQ